MTTVPVRSGVRVEVLQTLLSAEGGAPEGDAAACSRTFGARLPSLPRGRRLRAVTGQRGRASGWSRRRSKAVRGRVTAPRTANSVYITLGVAAVVLVGSSSPSSLAGSLAAGVDIFGTVDYN